MAPTVRHLRFGLVLAIGTTLACGGPSIDDHVARGDQYRAASQFQEAIIEYRNAIQIDPQRGDVRMKLAEAHVETRNLGAALREYVRAADLLPSDLDAQLKAGTFLLLAGAFEDAEERAKKAIAIDASSIDAMILMANTRAGLKDLDGALTEYQEAATQNPDDRVYAGMATIQLARGEVAEAEASFRKAVAIAPQSVSARLALANFLWASRRPAEAEAELKSALALDAANVLANRALGVFYLAAGRAADAEPHFKSIADTVKTPEATLALADYYVLTRRFDEARSVLRELGQDDKSWAVASTREAGIDALEGFRAQGTERIRTVLERYPDDRQARLLLARLHLADGKLDDALAEATTIVKEEPTSTVAGDAFMIIGRVHALFDRPESAIKAYEEVLARFPQPFAADLALASLHMSSGALDKARTYVQQALVLQPAHPVARALNTRLLMAEGKAAEARVELASLERDYPDAPPVLNLLAARHLTEGNRAAARAAYIRSAERAPNNLEALTGLVQLDLLDARREAAVARVEEALKVSSQTGDLLMLAARTYAVVGRWESVEELLNKAIDLEPSRLRAYGLLAELFVRQNRLADAETQFATMVEKNPTSVATNTMLGMLLDMRGKLDEAERQYERTLALDPEAAVAANNLAYRWAEANRNLDQALQLAQTAQRRLPDEPNVADTLGWIYYRKGMNAAAIRELERSVRTNPKDPLARYHLGMAFHQAGELDKARTTLRAALDLGTSFPGADVARQTLAALGG